MRFSLALFPSLALFFPRRVQKTPFYGTITRKAELSVSAGPVGQHAERYGIITRNAKLSVPAGSEWEHAGRYENMD